MTEAGPHPAEAASPAGDLASAAPAGRGVAPTIARRYTDQAINWVGLWTLYAKEVQRFTGIWLQTVGAPVVTSLIFYAVFSLALGRRVETVAGVPFMAFLAPGLIIMSVAQNAFANTSSSLLISKIQGNIVDVLMPPLSATELATGYVLAGVTRGVVVGLCTALALAIFAPLGIANPLWFLLFGVLGSMMLSSLGVAVGIWAEKFDHIAAATNFVIMPLTFLSGTFYSIERLAGPFEILARLNPVFYMIDGFRAGFIGHSDSPIWLGLAVLVGVNAALWGLCLALLRSGYKLKT